MAILIPAPRLLNLVALFKEFRCETHRYFTEGRFDKIEIPASASLHVPETMAYLFVFKCTRLLER